MEDEDDVEDDDHLPPSPGKEDAFSWPTVATTQQDCNAATSKSKQTCKFEVSFSSQSSADRDIHIDVGAIEDQLATTTDTSFSSQLDTTATPTPDDTTVAIADQPTQHVDAPAAPCEYKADQDSPESSEMCLQVLSFPQPILHADGKKYGRSFVCDVMDENQSVERVQVYPVGKNFEMKAKDTPKTGTEEAQMSQAPLTETNPPPLYTDLSQPFPNITETSGSFTQLLSDHPSAFVSLLSQKLRSAKLRLVHQPCLRHQQQQPVVPRT